MAFFDRLRERIRATDGMLSIGLNPDLARLPDDCREYDYPRRAFNRRIIDATHDHAAAYAVTPAFYADAEGWTAMAETVALAHGRGVPVVLDAKYSDVPNPDAELLDSVDAVTVSPYLGRDALAPLLDGDSGRSEGLGVFVTCRTPNAGATDLQDRDLAGEEREAEPTEEGDGEEETTRGDDEERATLAHGVADLAASWADDAAADVGLLVGGPSEAVESLRERAPGLPFLVVGGARNDPEVAAHAVSEGGEGVAPHRGAGEAVGLVETSREVLYAGETAGRGRRRGQDDYAAAARESARRLKRQLNRHR
ncbi:orotidine-5'-phosphate decarboxylase [Halorussus salinisoli]|uniref:orotidine-5'-phosphate decarboxylase n=1 Tax=Halorussus salinisoli TaxID=2558242 RepID=UPI0010C17F15|nr:orotidine-5'-phosphate decarboxylase [Halorussus salinisoli]